MMKQEDSKGEASRTWKGKLSFVYDRAEGSNGNSIYGLKQSNTNDDSVNTVFQDIRGSKKVLCPNISGVYGLLHALRPRCTPSWCQRQQGSPGKALVLGKAAYGVKVCFDSHRKSRATKSFIPD